MRAAEHAEHAPVAADGKPAPLSIPAYIMCVGTERMLQSINDGWYRRADFQSWSQEFFLGWDFLFYRERSERDERENTAGTAMVPAPGKTKSIKSLLTMKRR